MVILRHDGYITYVQFLCCEQIQAIIFLTTTSVKLLSINFILLDLGKVEFCEMF